jgi:hypothetical protein
LCNSDNKNQSERDITNEGMCYDASVSYSLIERYSWIMNARWSKKCVRASKSVRKYECDFYSESELENEYVCV